MRTTIGKAIGAVIGAYVGFPDAFSTALCATLGGILGHVIVDRRWGTDDGNVRRPWGRSHNQKDATGALNNGAERATSQLDAKQSLAGSAREAFLTLTFMAMGRMAKADGVVPRSAISFAEQAMDELGVVGVQRKRAIQLFRAGKDPRCDLVGRCDALCAVTEESSEVRTLAMEYLCRAVLATGRNGSSARATLKQVGRQLNLPRGALTSLLEGLRQEVESDRQRKNDAYVTLGLQPGATPEAVRLAYRRMMSRHHPDKVRGDATAGARASDRSAAIRDAYDTLRHH